MPLRQMTAQGQLTPFVNGYLNHLQQNMSIARCLLAKIRDNADSDLLSFSRILVNASILTQKFI